MDAQLLATSSAVARALETVSSKKGLVNSNPLAGMFLTTLIMTIGLWILAAPTALVTTLSPLAVLAFVGDGLVGTAIARLILFVAIDRVGAGLTMSVIGSQSLFAALFAFLLIQEEITLFVLAGSVLIFFGIVALLGNGREQKWRRRDIVFPLAASVLFGLISVFKKVGLREAGSPILGSAISSIAGFIAIILYLAISGKKKEIRPSKTSAKFFILAGVFTIMTLVLNYSALMFDNVSVVMSLFNTAPLFTIFLSRLFLHDVETITLKIVAGSILVVIGAIMVIL